MQGYFEDSNVSAIEEMIGLIEVSRAHEANQKDDKYLRPKYWQGNRNFRTNRLKYLFLTSQNHMNLSLYSGATGMQAQQLNLNVISNNIANVNTTGFKKNKIEFQDLLYQNPRQVGGQTGAGNVIPTGVEMGNGTKVISTAKIFTQGQLTQTSEKMDIAIDGVGFSKSSASMVQKLTLEMGLSRSVQMARLLLLMQSTSRRRSSGLILKLQMFLSPLQVRFHG